MNVLRSKKTTCFLIASVFLLALLGACRSRKNTPSEDALSAAGIAPFYIDAGLINLDSIDPPPPLQHPERLAAIQEWVDKTNSWYLPFIIRYLPSIKTEGYRRIMPVLGSDAEGLLTVVNDSDIEINLNAKDWSTNSNSLATALRVQIIKKVLTKHLSSIPKAKFDSDEKSKVITEIYMSGIPVYLSAFGTEMAGSALVPALEGDRSEIEKYFNLFRTEMKIATGRDVQIMDNDMALEAPISRDDALRMVGLWVSYKVESTLGSDAMIDAINAGPLRLYELYLTTEPGILRSLEMIPEEVKPLLNDSISH
jgi:hypothetical protein